MANIPHPSDTVITDWQHFYPATTKGNLLLTNGNNMQKNTPVQAADLTSSSWSYGVDCYSTINPMNANRRIDNAVSELAAVWVDLDCHRENLSPEEAEIQLLLAVHQNQIPEPSALYFSGRGLWAFWLLRDDAGNLPIATQENLQLHRQCCQSVVAKFLHLGADFNCTNPSRLFRQPGSINSANGIATKFKITYVNNDLLTYDLSSLAQYFPTFTIHTEPKPAIKYDYQQSEKLGKNHTLSEYGKSGYIARWEKALALVYGIAGLRNGIMKGSREVCCHLIASFHRRLKYSIEHSIRDITSRNLFRPALTAATIRKQVIAAQTELRNNRLGRIRYTTILNQLAVTSTEQQELIALGLLPKQPSPSAEQRKDAILKIIIAEPTLSIRKVQERLAQKGIKASVGTVQKAIADLR